MPDSRVVRVGGPWSLMLFPKQYLTLAERGLANSSAGDDIVFPLVYLQRHCLELILKDLILACFYIAEQQDVAGEARCRAQPPEREHRFGKLLSQLKRSLIEVGYGQPAQLPSLEALALRFTRLERGSRERFRYAFPDPFKDGKAPRHSFEKPVEIPVHELQEALRHVHHECVDIDNDESLLRQLYDESGALFEKAVRLGRA